MMTNTNNDYNKHIEAFENHLEALWGERWEELTAKKRSLQAVSAADART